MIRPWSEIRSFYGQLGAPLQVMLRLVEQIEGSRYANGIHGETSVCDLRITQSPKSAYPYGPYLRISPQADGLLEFRYFDTYVRNRQWSRIDYLKFSPGSYYVETFRCRCNRLYCRRGRIAFDPEIH